MASVVSQAAARRARPLGLLIAIGSLASLGACSAASVGADGPGMSDAALAGDVETPEGSEPRYCSTEDPSTCLAGEECYSPRATSDLGTCVEHCTNVAAPVCGADGRTYANECLAKRDQIPVVSTGPCSSHDGAAPQGGVSVCDHRTGGAIVTLEVDHEKNESFAVWSTNDSFIDEAKRLLASGENRTPNFDQVIAGADCNTGHGWHVDPASMAWADFTTEVCDGTPSYLDDNLTTWTKQVGRYCPWGVKVLAVVDHR